MIESDCSNTNYITLIRVVYEVLIRAFQHVSVLCVVCMCVCACCKVCWVKRGEWGGVEVMLIQNIHINLCPHHIKRVVPAHQDTLCYQVFGVHWAYFRVSCVFKCTPMRSSHFYLHLSERQRYSAFQSRCIENTNTWRARIECGWCPSARQPAVMSRKAHAPQT